MVLRKSFYIHWSVGRSPRVHEVNPGRDPSDRREKEEFFSPLSLSHAHFHNCLKWGEKYDFLFSFPF